MNYQTIKVRFQESICFLQIYRPEANNSINDLLIEECHHVLAMCEEAATIVVLEGLPEVFCFGADFKEIHGTIASGQRREQSPEPLYDLWLKLATGPYITISHVRGKANAGGVGFVAASDIVLADETAQFSLSELLFGLFPACVLPFLIRRMGFQKAHYLTLSTQPISFQQAHAWGLVDAYEAQSESLLRKHLLRFRRLSKTGISRYKRYMNELYNSLLQSKSLALAANQEIFSDPRNLEGIFWYIDKGQFPWER
ncbi:MAG TPA: enoyl-CoA hydratase/isomerase [Methylomusa anaerophila]|uniref:Putative polyketide biosynthesis enoyl-CoA hydratase PksH n=1 Tax=Methylomusa anaerophila TaxID=1930071 RepID=A0A348AQV3_9FIRM|nr:enoyl-CoA hydratase/isomerase [Methylomusa anaerophila]BBB93451.1 putative polyketide biosynthesis enoyl-CoA hydratase PksH [Methylomusa anaerophila]HML90299.1 enoyl-CoA hydratase/isomerase [Methylomusa anaerophila]